MGNPPVTYGYPHKGPVTQTFDRFLDGSLNRLFNEHSFSVILNASMVIQHYCNVLNKSQLTLEFPDSDTLTSKDPDSTAYQLVPISPWRNTEMKSGVLKNFNKPIKI